jgi:hypothetical protein
MTLMKSLLLGSAATLVVVAGAQAADLPTKKGAPAAEYVKICKIDGMAGFVIPGSDTCLKISGYVTAQIEAGNLTTGYYNSGEAGFTGTNAGSALGVNPTTGVIGALTGPVTGATANQLTYTSLDQKYRDGIGYTTRAELDFLAKTNTAYGVLTSDIDLQFNYGSGFDNTGAGNGFINHAFLNWAGITAGKANSFFSFFGGGEAWANIFSPDQQGYNQPLLLAYTATFGGGFSATFSAQDPKLTGPSSGTTIGGTDEFFSGNSTYLGMRSPDFVLSVDLAQGWGGAHIAGVAHQVLMEDFDTTPNDLNIWGWAIDGGLKFNLPMLGAGDNIQFQGVWSRNAIWYSGVSDGMWGENGMVNGNGISMPVADALSNYNGTWATPTAWSLTAISEFHFGPTFSFDPEISYLQINWGGLSGSSLGAFSTNSQSWIGGGVFHWDPVAHLDFNLELLYQTTHQSQPGLWATEGTIDGVAAAWHSNTSGVEGRFEITRDF